MAITAYCKKCNREVAPGDICPICGTKLPKSAVHAAWVVERNPAADWMCWNAVMRWLVPAGLAVLAMALLLEGFSGGPEAVEKMFRGSFPLALGILLAAVLLVVMAALLLQGRELMDYVIDSRGIHVTRYLPEPTALKLLTRLKSPGLLAQTDPENPVLLLETRDLAWRNVSRVQLWPEKCYILFYAPSWWLRIPVRCTPFSWEDAMEYVREKLGKKKAVELPEHLRVQAASAAGRSTGTGAGASSRGNGGTGAIAPRRARPEAMQEPEPEASGEAEPWPEEVPPDAGEQMTLDLSDAPGNAE